VLDSREIALSGEGKGVAALLENGFENRLVTSSANSKPHFAVDWGRRSEKEVC